MNGSLRPPIAKRDAHLLTDDLVGCLYRADENTVLDVMSQ